MSRFLKAKASSLFSARSEEKPPPVSSSPPTSAHPVAASSSSPDSSSAETPPADAPRPVAKVPLVHAPESARPSLRAPRSSAQEETFASLAEYALDLHHNHPGLAADDAYREWEERWVKNPITIDRYCRAARWNLDNAKKRLKESLEWRRDYRPEVIRPEEVRIEAETGKQVLSGFDAEGRPILYLRPGRENTEPTLRQVRSLSFTLERAIDLMEQTGQEKLVIVLDFNSVTQAKMTPMNISSRCLTMLQKHYVERLHRAYVVNVPWWIHAFFSAISPMLDPVTRDKMYMAKSADLSTHLPPSQLETDFGGEYRYEFTWPDYWDAVMGACGVLEDGTRGEKSKPPTDASHVGAAATPPPTSVAATTAATDPRVEPAAATVTTERDNMTTGTETTQHETIAPKTGKADDD